VFSENVQIIGFESWLVPFLYQNFEVEETDFVKHSNFLALLL
jgi:hypothetical protein